MESVSGDKKYEVGEKIPASSGEGNKGRETNYGNKVLIPITLPTQNPHSLFILLIISPLHLLLSSSYPPSGLLITVPLLSLIINKIGLNSPNSHDHLFPPHAPYIFLFLLHIRSQFRPLVAGCWYAPAAQSALGGVG